MNVLLDNLLPIGRSKRDGTMRGIARLANEDAKRKARRRKGSGSGPALPPGVSQRELDALAREAEAAGPAVSQAEIDALFAAEGGK